MLRFVLAGLLALGVFTVGVPGSGPIAPGQALADQKDKRLPDLFRKLKSAPDPEAAAEIEQAIWAIWFDSGSKPLDLLMAQGAEAIQNDDYPTALARFNEIIKKKPDFAEGWNRRATLYYLMGDFQKSLADIDRTLKLEPRHIGALSGLGLVNLQLDKLEAAEDAYKRVLAISPQNLGAQHNLDQVREMIKKRSI